MRADAPVGRLDEAYCAPLIPRRDARSHKFDHGTLVCVAGSLDYAGAALLCGQAAVRGGAGLVALAVPRSLQPVLAGRVPEAITIGLPEVADGQPDPERAVAAILEREPAALVLGPGLNESRAYELLLMELLTRAGVPCVVDAGALTMLALGEAWSTRVPAGQCVLTPHAGEFARLDGSPPGESDEERVARSRAAARRFGQVVVLKGAHTVVAHADRAAVAPFANAALATAGSGDVLAGLIGALLAQGLSTFDAACLGVYLHGRAGQRLSESLGDAGLLASDLPYQIALARSELAGRGR